MQRVLAMVVIVVAALMTALGGADQPVSPATRPVASTHPATGPGARKPWPASGPKVMWEVQVGEGFASAAVHGDSVFLLDRIDDKQDVLRVFNLSDGQEQWRYAYDAPGKLQYNGSRTRPAVDEKHVYTLGPFGHVHAISRQTHKPVWSVNLVGPYSDRVRVYGFSHNPLIVGDLLIVSAMGRKAGLVAFNRNSGEMEWKTRTFGSGETYVSPTLVTIGGVEQIIMLNDQALIAFDPASGELLWQYKDVICLQPIAPPLVMDDGRVFVSSGCKAQSFMVKVTRDDGKWATTQLAHNQELGMQMHGAVRVGDYLYFVGNTNINPLVGMVCMDFDMNVKWQTLRKPNFTHGDWRLIDGIIYALEGREGTLHAVWPDPEKYVELGRAKVLSSEKGDGPMWSPMTVAGTKLLCRNQKVLRCLELSPDAATGPQTRPRGPSTAAADR